MFKSVLIFLMISSVNAIDIDKKALTLGTFLDKSDAENLASKFEDDNIYIKITENNKHELMYVVYSTDIPYDKLGEYLRKYRQVIPTVYVTSFKIVKRLASFEKNRSDELYRYPLEQSGPIVNNDTKPVAGIEHKPEEKIESSLEKKVNIENEKKPEAVKDSLNKKLEENIQEEEPAGKIPQTQTKPSSNEENIIKNDRVYFIVSVFLNILLFLIAIYIYFSKRNINYKPVEIFDNESYNEEIKQLEDKKKLIHLDMLRFEKRLKVLKNEINLKTKGKFTHKIYSAKEFYDLSDVIINMAKREERDISIMYINIKNYDQIKEKCDLNAKTQFIANFVSILDFHTRESDIIARLTNSEFTLLLPYSSKEGAEVLKEKLLLKANNQTVHLNDKYIKLDVDAEVDVINMHIKEPAFEALERLEKNYYKGEA